MSNATAYVALATIFAIRNVRAMDLPDTRADLSTLFEETYQWRADELTMTKILAQLDAWQCVTIIDDKYAGELLRLYPARTDDTLTSLAEDGNADLVSKARLGGIDWFKRVFTNQEFWNDLYHDELPEKKRRRKRTCKGHSGDPSIGSNSLQV